jgi:hypothetical protein
MPNSFPELGPNESVLSDAFELSVGDYFQPFLFRESGTTIRGRYGMPETAKPYMQFVLRLYDQLRNSNMEAGDCKDFALRRRGGTLGSWGQPSDKK